MRTCGLVIASDVEADRIKLVSQIRYLTVQIDDVKQYDKALAYMRRLGPIEADKNLQKYGKVLLTHLPEQTTQLLVDLCSGTLAKGLSPSPTPGNASPAPPANAGG